MARVDRAARGSASPLAAALARVELYGYDSSGERVDGAKIGRGVRGTKGAVEGSAYEEPDPIHVDPVLQGRYDGLGRADRETATAIVDDGYGETPQQRFFGVRGYMLDLAQRVAFQIASPPDIEKWSKKLASGDDAPALAAAKRLGAERIEVAAKRWWRG